VLKKPFRISEVAARIATSLDGRLEAEAPVG
jgi:hypothetical protein